MMVLQVPIGFQHESPNKNPTSQVFQDCQYIYKSEDKQRDVWINHVCSEKHLTVHLTWHRLSSLAQRYAKPADPWAFCDSRLCLLPIHVSTAITGILLCLALCGCWIFELGPPTWMAPSKPSPQPPRFNISWCFRSFLSELMGDLIFLFLMLKAPYHLGFTLTLSRYILPSNLRPYFPVTFESIWNFITAYNTSISLLRLLPLGLSQGLLSGMLVSASVHSHQKDLGRCH